MNATSQTPKQEALVLGCKRIKEGFLLGTNRDRSVNLALLKQRLFAWHKASFYGTALEWIDYAVGKDSGIILPDALAPGYFAHAIHEAAIHVTLAPELELLVKAAPVLLRCLKEGRFVPDFAKWQEGKPGWRLLPEGQDAVIWEETLKAAAETGNDPVSGWLDGLMGNLLGPSSPAGLIWEQLLEQRAPLKAVYSQEKGKAKKGGQDGGESAQSPGSAGMFLDEEDWLIAIGWKEDSFPYLPALRLKEPEADTQLGEWALETVLLDRSGAGNVILWEDWMDKALPVGSGEASGQNGTLPAAGTAAAEVAAALSGENGAALVSGAATALTDATGISAAQLGLLRRRLDKERARWLLAAPQLADPDNAGQARSRLHDQEAWRFLTEDSVKLAEAGASVLMPGWWETVRKQKMLLKAKVRSSVGSKDSMFGMDSIIQFDWRMAVGGATLTEEEFRRLAEQQRRLVQVNGQWILLDPDMLEEIKKVMKRLQKKKGLSFREALELHLLGGADIGEASGEPSDGEADGRDAASMLRLEVELNSHLSRMVDQLQQTSSIPVASDPAGFQGELRRYQREGVSWMTFLRRFGLGGCLADDMGLGKTVQWIVYVLHLKENGLLDTPALLICPTSVIGNWQKELERFAPSLAVHLHYGTRRAKAEAFPASVNGADVVITSYALAHLDEEELAGMEWSTLCLDEAQNIKNVYTKQAGSIRKLNARHRMALTGTPIENRLTELWSIFDYMNPGYLGTLGEFRRTFVTEVEKGNAEKTAQVQKLARPFLLRRVKKDPAIQLDLPEKNEMKSYVPLTLEQGALYESILKEMFDKVDRLPPMERRGLILATLTRLKQVCDHPLLLTKQTGEGQDGEGIARAASPGRRTSRRNTAGQESGNRGEAKGPNELVARSSKLSRLLEMVEELRTEGDKCLIFTQFVEMGHLLRNALEQELGEDVLFLHGGVSKSRRDEMIEGFQQLEKSGIFILSLKAGGVGLNLTAANHVFHFDRWWNPAVENQATDRAFRIGQTRDVQVHKFISLGTLEERIDQMIDKKQGLSQQIIGSGEGWITELSTDELRELFSLRKQWMHE